jgi:hypothetical protein
LQPDLARSWLGGGNLYDLGCLADAAVLECLHGSLLARTDRIESRDERLTSR